ncbi:MAG: 50S ribosomal protein L23 [Endozoicomonadaceae bacterium]|nr:50S ribosomal protein L23 [Endozoicomonadaceae bacterium]
MNQNQERFLKVLLEPRFSEKANQVSDQGYHVFRVAIDSNKLEIKKAVELFFKVEVKQVRTLIRKGKTKRNAKGQQSKKRDIKLAYVRLNSGQHIDLMDTK